MDHWVIGALFAFSSGAYGWAWTLYTRLARKIDSLWVRVTNHQAHEIDDLRRRLDDLERRAK